MSGPTSMLPGAGKGGCATWIEALAIDGEALGRSRGGLTSEIHLAVDGRGLPISNLGKGTSPRQRRCGYRLATVL